MTQFRWVWTNTFKLDARFLINEHEYWTRVLAIVPLNKTALALLEKYHDKERKTLYPFISQQKYNVNIKKAFKLAGLNRKMAVLNPLTSQHEPNSTRLQVATWHAAPLSAASTNRSKTPMQSVRWVAMPRAARPSLVIVKLTRIFSAPWLTSWRDGFYLAWNSKWWTWYMQKCFLILILKISPLIIWRLYIITAYFQILYQNILPSPNYRICIKA